MTSNSSNSSKCLHPWTGNPGLKKLCTLLRNEGHRVLSGSSAFTLTTEVLAQLNSDCRRHSITENDITAAELTNERSFMPLTSRLRAQQETNRVKAEWCNYIQFIKDFMLSTPSLKLIRYSSTLSSPISLHRFGNLTSLDLRKVPIHMVEGLHKLRGTLVSITVYRSVDRVKDLLEYCGGDMTAPMVWPQLTFVSFMFNSISTLDDSLRLLPHVEVLDLSHNSLEMCEEFLQYLGDVQRITLAYNFLTTVPLFSLTTRSSLTHLVLRGNNLDNMIGIDMLTTIQELDLGENCISDHSSLNPLSFLKRLKRLQLDGNPVFYHKQHRLLTAAHLAPPAVSLEFELDKRKLTASEISKAETKRTRISKLSSPHGLGIRSFSSDSDGFSASSGIGTENESAASIVSRTSKTKGTHKKLRSKHRKIIDLETSGEVSSRDATPGTSPHPQNLEQQMKSRRDEAINTKKEIEELRQHYGPNWLQAIEDRDVFKKKKAVLAAYTSETSDTDNTEMENNRGAKFIVGSKTSSSSDTRNDNEWKKTREPESDNEYKYNGFPTDDDLYLTDTRMSDANNPIMAAIARLAAGYSTDDSDVGNKTGSKIPVINSQPEFIVNSDLSKSAAATVNRTEYNGFVSASSSSCCQFSGTTINSNHHIADIQNQVFSDVAVDKTANKSEPISTVNSESKASEQIPMNQQLAQKHEEKPFTKSEQNTSSLSKPSRDLSDSRANIKENSELEESSVSARDLLEEEVTESMFATLPLHDNEMIIVTLTASYLVEKDIKGKVTEKLELASLRNMDWRKMTKTSDGTVGKLDHVLNNNSQSKVEVNEVISGENVKNQDIKAEQGHNGDVNDAAENIQLDLKFGYVRKDRQSRRYVMDHADGQIILAHLQPFLDSREDEEKAKSSLVMQCLKCNRTFLKSELILHKSQLPTSGSSKDLQSIQELMSKTTLICPKCGSTLIIELEQASTNVRSSGSSTSTPAGSYTSSAGSYFDQSRKPASLIRNKSFDRAKDGHSGATTLKDKKLVRSFIVSSKDQTVSEREELVYIDDHFAASSMTDIKTSSTVGEMMTSLYGDSSSRGRKSLVRRMSLGESHVTNYNQNESTVVDMKQQVLMDSGCGSVTTNGSDKLTHPVNIGRRVAALENEKYFTNEVQQSRRTSIHKNLAAMEDIVNSLVSEGKHLEEQEILGSSSYSSSKGKSVSITAFMKSSRGSNRKTSICSIDGVGTSPILRHSESSSSIAVIPTSGADLDGLHESTLSSSLPTSFSEETLTDGGIFVKTIEEDRTSTLSPLSSNICSSMVSSVYESSVNNPDSESNIISHGCDDDDGLINGTHNVVTVEPSADDVANGVESKTSSEDLTSIYDHPREPKLTAMKQHSSKLRIVSALDTKIKDGNSVAVGLDSQGGSEAAFQSVTKGSLAVNVTDDLATDENSETDDENEQDVLPQYAFHHLNHRLTLYMMMSLFGTEEEFVCKLQSEVVQYIVEKPYEGILVLSSARFYILKVTSEDHSQPPDHWLQCVEIQPIPELRFIDVGLGGQSLRIEFVTDCSSYTFITRNRDKTTQFVEILHTNLAKYALSQGIASHVVVNENVDQTSLDVLDRDVVSKVVPDQKLLHYCMGFIERGNQKLFPVSFVITTCDICLVCTNHQWPQPHLQAPITEESVGKQFTVLERQKISNIATVEVCEATMKKIRLELFNETEGISTSWNITLATRQSTVGFINALSEPWAKEFGVEMDVVYAELPF